MKTVIAYPLDGREDAWVVSCPYCRTQYNCSGYFDPEDTYNCECSNQFTADKLEFEDGSYIE